MQSVGMTGAELRLVYGRNVVDLTDAELDRARAAVEARGMRVLGIASPVLKCVLPNGPPIDARFQQDVFGSAYTYEDQPRLATRALEVAARTGAPMIRVFSGLADGRSRGADRDDRRRVARPRRTGARRTASPSASRTSMRATSARVRRRRACWRRFEHPGGRLDLGPCQRVRSWERSRSLTGTPPSRPDA